MYLWKTRQNKIIIKTPLINHGGKYKKSYRKKNLSRRNRKKYKKKSKIKKKYTKKKGGSLKKILLNQYYNLDDKFSIIDQGDQVNLRVNDKLLSNNLYFNACLLKRRMSRSMP